MLPKCCQNVAKNQSKRSQNVAKMKQKCSQNVAKMQPKCSQNVAKMQQKCSQIVAKTQPNCSKITRATYRKKVFFFLFFLILISKFSFSCNSSKFLQFGVNCLVFWVEDQIRPTQFSWAPSFSIQAVAINFPDQTISRLPEY